MAIFENKTTWVLMVFLGLFTSLKAQKTDFEGQLTYSIQFVPKTKEIRNKDLATFFGDTVIAFVKKGNYRQKYLNAFGITDVIYIAADNNWYYKMYGIDTLYFLDCSQEKKTRLLETHKSNSTLAIAGYNCKQLTITTSSGKSTYYYADSLYINPSYFSKHQLYFYNLYAKQTESIYLKAQSENELYFSSMTAFKVEKKDIDDSIFTLPKLPRLQK